MMPLDPIVTDEDIDNLRHMLGARNDQTKRYWGYRNHFAPGGGPDEKSMERLESVGLVKRGRPYHETYYYHATEQGCATLGFSQAQTRRALRAP